MDLPALPLGLAVEFRERLSGSYRDRAGRDRPLRLDFYARSSRAEGVHTFVAGGTIDADGLASRAALAGTIAFSPASWTRLSLRYEATFMSIDGTKLRLVAHKNDLRFALYSAFTTLRGTIEDASSGAIVAPFAARFDARGDLRWWLSHLRLTRPRADETPGNARSG